MADENETALPAVEVTGGIPEPAALTRAERLTRRAALRPDNYIFAS